MTSPTIQDALKPTLDRQFVDLDPIFNHNLDEDFDFRASGITRFSFCAVYMDWIQFCYQKRKQSDTQANKADESQSKQTNANASDETKLTANEHDENVSKGNSSTEFTPSPRVGKSTRSAAEKNVRNDADVVSLSVDKSEKLKNILLFSSVSESNVALDFPLTGLRSVGTTYTGNSDSHAQHTVWSGIFLAWLACAVQR